MKYKTRRIFKTALTGSNTIREIIQFLFLAELIFPVEKRIWIVSPWISNVLIIDNRGSNFDALNPEWSNKEIRLMNVLIQLLSVGCPVGIVTNHDEHNTVFLNLLSENAREKGLDMGLTIIQKDQLHTKGILTSTSLFMGSMNITYNGLEINDESMDFDTRPESLAQARLTFESYDQ